MIAALLTQYEQCNVYPDLLVTQPVNSSEFLDEKSVIENPMVNVLPIIVT